MTPHNNAYENLMDCISAGLHKRVIELIPGERYDVDDLWFIAWNTGEEFDGDWRDYFDCLGHYMGPDDNGMEPVCVNDPEHAIRNLGEV